MKNLKTYIIQYIKTTNDSNGNPRRMYMITNLESGIIGFINEGYDGCPLFGKIKVAWTAALNLQPREYKRLKSRAPMLTLEEFNTEYA